VGISFFGKQKPAGYNLRAGVEVDERELGDVAFGENGLLFEKIY